MKNIYFLGGGNMATAIVSGLSQSNLFQITICERFDARRDFLQQNFPNANITDSLPELNSDDILVLAVKPQDMQTALQSVVLNGALVLSIAAGLSCHTLSQWLDGTMRIIRIMPNTPAQVGLGMAGLFADIAATNEDKQLAQEIMNSVGKIIWVEKEDDLHTVTAISGSGPAYVFYCMNALYQAALSQGMNQETAYLSVLQTFVGASQLALQSDDSFNELCRKVTSKGGTTAAALNIFEQANLNQIMLQAIEACAKRSIEMSQSI
ncbi:MAG: pyrroline-5-carboxylate reductase [Neisseriaceae bacterium]|nr:pyrroline-5-carboxylate reductase [Neisseriaceae bacterium]